MPRLLRSGTYVEPQVAEQLGCEHSAFFGGGSHGRRQKEALVEKPGCTEGGTKLLAEPGCCQSERRVFHIFRFPGDIAADGRKTAAGILDQ